MADVIAPFVGDRATALAGSLIEHFGGLSGALASDPNTIQNQELAAGCQLLHSAKALLESAARERLHGSVVNSNDPAIRDYLQLSIGSAREECFHVTYADSHGRYLRDDIVSRGGRVRVQVCARTLFHQALNFGANRLLFAHNHPSGQCEPSEDDISTTERFRSVAECLDMEIVDHLIVTSSRTFSMRRGRLL